jgi:murein DD-endopeptidase MepM/ murein hydrolase activator NlpD
MDNTDTISFPKSPFTDVFVRENNLDRRGFTAWFFYPGMEFGAQGVWWGNRGIRTRPHEGIDFCFYRGASDSILHIDDRAKIPAMYDGIVARIIGDFLGKTIILKHTFPDVSTGTFLTIYGHTNPGEGLEAGQSVKADEVIATLAAFDGSSDNCMEPRTHPL